MLRWKYIGLCIFFTILCNTASAESANDSIVPPRYSYELKVNPGVVLATDQYAKKWLKDKKTWSMAAELHYTPQPKDNDDFAKDYNYPTFTAGLRYSFNHGTTMHREADPDWGKLVPVDYVSQLGNVVTLYGTFSRPLYRNRHWELAYILGCGVGYSHKKYNLVDEIDNELIGSHLNIYFTAGFSATYRVSRNWGVKGGIDFSHHSNGALYRPNKGTNYLGPYLGLVYYCNDEEKSFGQISRQTKEGDDRQREATPESHLPATVTPPLKAWYAEVTLGFGGKALMEDWQRTQFQTDPGEPDYRTDHFTVYAAYSLQADVLYRYARRWASGVGVDLFYGSYSNRVRDIDVANGHDEKHSPWSVGIALKHEVFYRNISVRMGVGYYLYRHMGHSAKKLEKPYYERIGVHYAFPKLNGLSVGFNVNAHLNKADFTELQISYPIKL